MRLDYRKEWSSSDSDFNRLVENSDNPLLTKHVLLETGVLPSCVQSNWTPRGDWKSFFELTDKLRQIRREKSTVVVMNLLKQYAVTYNTACKMRNALNLLNKNEDNIENLIKESFRVRGLGDVNDYMLCGVAVDDPVLAIDPLACPVSMAAFIIAANIVDVTPKEVTLGSIPPLSRFVHMTEHGYPSAISVVVSQFPEGNCPTTLYQTHAYRNGRPAFVVMVEKQHEASWKYVYPDHRCFITF